VKALILLLALGALAAQNPERHTPPGEWCQRPPITSKKAHECHCAEHNCADPEPTHVSAHVDPSCSNYCHIHECLCAKQDCP
jgi:hypothetical protein